MTISVVRPGMLSSLQDLGRYGYQYLGVSVGGAMDSRAHRLANMLVGNDTDMASLEITLAGPTLQFHEAACIAITGADLSPTLDGQPIANYRPLIVQAGQILAFGARRSGLRAYLAWHGGIALDAIMGSTSTYLRAGMGGYHGRALKAKDESRLRRPLALAGLGALASALWDQRVYLPAGLGLRARTTLRAMPGPHTALFTPDSIAAFFQNTYTVSPQSERMGYRLQGPSLDLISRQQQLSEAVGVGSVQVPPDGQAIILMADRQTTGGYAKIAHICSVDIPQVAQTMPGEALQFVEVSVEDAMALDQQREAAMQSVYEALAPVRRLLADAA